MDQRSDKIDSAKREVEILSRKLKEFHKIRTKMNYTIQNCDSRLDLPSVMLGRTPEERKEYEIRSQLTEKATPSGAPQPIVFARLQLKRQLQAHFGKVHALDWATNSYKLASASQDGKMIIWDAIRAQKLNYIPLMSNWTMTLAFEKSPNSKIVALAGLDNICSLYDISNTSSAFPIRELKGHNGYISCCKFVDSCSILTSSGDKSVRLWDIEKSKTILQFDGHDADVMTLSLSPTNNNVFVSGSIDTTCKLWDIRVPHSYIGSLYPNPPLSGSAGMHMQEIRRIDPLMPNFTIRGHRTDVNCVQFFPDGNSIVSGSDDATVRWFDLRSLSKINAFRDRKIVAQVHTLTTSLSGRLVIAGHSDGIIRVWDILSHEEVVPARSSSTANDSMGSRPSSASQLSTTQSSYRKIPTSTGDVEGLRPAIGTSGFSKSANRSKSSGAATAVSQLYPSDKNIGSARPSGSDGIRSSLLSSKEGAEARLGCHQLGEEGRAHDSAVSALVMTSFGDALASASWDSYIKVWV